MDEVWKACKQKNTGNVTVGNLNLIPVQVQALLHTLDINLISDTQEELQEDANEWAQELH